MNRFASARRVVVKVGTTTLTHGSGLLNYRRLERLVKTLADLKNSGKEIVLVSSGAIGVGMGELGLSARPQDMPTKQACAAVGQCELMYTYDKLFGEYNHSVAQILLTREDIVPGKRRGNAANTFQRLLEFGVVPIVNENDTVSTEEIEIGDNDTLSGGRRHPDRRRRAGAPLGYRRTLHRQSQRRPNRLADPRRRGRRCGDESRRRFQQHLRQGRDGHQAACRPDRLLRGGGYGNHQRLRSHPSPTVCLTVRTSVHTL